MNETNWSLQFILNNINRQDKTGNMEKKNLNIHLSQSVIPSQLLVFEQCKHNL